MNTQVIITKKAGHDIPKGFLEVALKKCPTYLGLVTQDVVDGNPLLETSAENKTTNIDELVKTLAQLKDIPVSIQLGNMSQDFDPETDMMPFVFQVAGEGDAPPQDILAVQFEGDFPNYNKPSKGHTDEYNLWEDFVFPTLMEKLEASDDVDDFFRRLRLSTFEQAVMNTVSHRACCVFTPLTGEPIAFGRNELGGEYDWGTTSNTFGWGTQGKLEEAAGKAIDAVKKTGGRLARALGTTAVAAPTKEPAKEDKLPDGVHRVPDKTPDPNDPFAAWPDTSAKTHTMRKVPTGLQGNARNRWIRIFLNLGPNDELPKGYAHQNFVMPVLNDLAGFAQEDLSTNDEVKRLQSRVIAFQTPSGKADASAVSKQMKEATEDPAQVQQPKGKPAEQPADDKRPPSDFLPEMSADDAKAAADLVTEWATNPNAPKALEVQRIESKWPKFSAARGIKFSDMARWSIADIKLLGKKAPGALALAFVEMRLKVHELGGFEPDVSDKPMKDVTPKPADKQVEVPLAKPAASAPKGGRLARAKAIA